MARRTVYRCRGCHLLAARLLSRDSMTEGCGRTRLARRRPGAQELAVRRFRPGRRARRRRLHPDRHRQTQRHRSPADVLRHIADHPANRIDELLP